MSPTDTHAAARRRTVAERRLTSKPVRMPATATEPQRQHYGCLEMQRRADMFTPHPKGRIAVALAAAWNYRHRAMAPSNDAGERKFWLGMARSAVSRAIEDRTVTQPALARMLALANALPSAVQRTVDAFREAVEA